VVRGLNIEILLAAGDFGPSEAEFEDWIVA
jgi:hypothetical protein